MNEALRNRKPYPMVELARRKQALAERGVEVLDFGTGDPVEPTPAFIREALVAAVPAVSQYPAIGGSQAFRQACADWMRRRFGVDLDADAHVLPARGSKEAMFHLPLALVDPQSERNGVVYPVPGYPVMEIGTLYAGAEGFPVPLTAENRYVMRPMDVPEPVLARAAIVWLNYPHNPTGQDLPEAVWREWVTAREVHGFVLCSDECYVELWHGERPRSVLEFATEGCLAFHSLSKRSGMTAYRSGFVAGDAALLAHYRGCRAAMGQAPTEWVEAAAIAAWSDQDHVEARRALFGRKRAVMQAGLEQLGFHIFPSTSTFYLWVATPDGEVDEAFAARLLERGIDVSPGSMFGPGNETWFRMALVPDLAGCEAALDRLRDL